MSASTLQIIHSLNLNGLEILKNYILFIILTRLKIWESSGLFQINFSTRFRKNSMRVILILLCLVGCSHNQYTCPKDTEIDRLAWQADCFNSSGQEDVSAIARCSYQSKELFCKE